VSIVSLTLYLQVVESGDVQASDDIITRTRPLRYVRRCALCALVCVGVGNLVITTGHQKQEEEVKKNQCKLEKEQRRDETFCLAGFCEKKENRTK
jgi:hypothetical protein